MGIVIGPIEFEGLYSDAMQLKALPGFLAILSEHKGEFELIDFSETTCVKTCFDSNNGSGKYRLLGDRGLNNNLHAAVHYTPALSHDQRQYMKLRLLEEME